MIQKTRAMVTKSTCDLTSLPGEWCKRKITFQRIFWYDTW